MATSKQPPRNHIKSTAACHSFTIQISNFSADTLTWRQFSPCWTICAYGDQSPFIMAGNVATSTSAEKPDFKPR